MDPLTLMAILKGGEFVANTVGSGMTGGNQLAMFNREQALREQQQRANEGLMAQHILSRRVALPLMDRATSAINARFAAGPGNLGQVGDQNTAMQGAASAFQPGHNANINEYDAGTQAALARLGITFPHASPSASQIPAPGGPGSAPTPPPSIHVPGPIGHPGWDLPASSSMAINNRFDVGAPPGSSPMASPDPTARAGTKPTSPEDLSNATADPTTGAAVRRRLTSPAYAY